MEVRSGSRPARWRAWLAREQVARGRGRTTDLRFSAIAWPPRAVLDGWVKLDLSALVQSARLVSLGVAARLQAERRPLNLDRVASAVSFATQTKEAMGMPKVSRDSAPQRQEAGPVVDLRGELDGYTVSFTSLLEDIDATPLLKGLPDDRCPCPHWGYVLKGKMTARYADRDEVFEAGDAFYTPPGHIPVQHEPGTEFVWFSPSEELRTAEAVMLKNMQAMQDGSTP